MTEKLYATADAAKYLKPPVSQKRVNRMYAQKKFPDAVIMGGIILIPQSDLDAENERRKTNVHVK